MERRRVSVILPSDQKLNEPMDPRLWARRLESRSSFFEQSQHMLTPQEGSHGAVRRHRHVERLPTRTLCHCKFGAVRCPVFFLLTITTHLPHGSQYPSYPLRLTCNDVNFILETKRPQPTRRRYV